MRLVRKTTSKFALALPAVILLGMSWIGFDDNAARALRHAWRGPDVQGDLLGHIRLYFSRGQDEGLYYEYASLMVGGGEPHRTKYASHLKLHRPASEGTPLLPYRDFHAEYPPLAFLPLVIPRLVSDSPQTYRRLFALEIALLLYALVVVAVAVRRRFGETVSLASVAGYAAVAAFLIGPLLIQRYDLIPAATVLLAYWSLQKGRLARSCLWLVVGAAIKIYPIIFLPLPFMIALKQRGWLAAGRLTAVTLLGFGIITVPFVLLSADGFLAMFRHHTGRGLQIESLYSLALQLQNLGWDGGFLASANVSMSDVVVGGASSLIGPWTFPLMLASLGAVIVMLWRKRDLPLSDPIWLVAFSLLTAAFLILSPIASPQYVIWFFPLVLAFPHPQGRLPRLAYLFYALSTQVQFDLLYGLLKKLSGFGTIALTFRWLACFIFVAVVLKQVTRFAPLSNGGEGPGRVFPERRSLASPAERCEQPREASAAGAGVASSRAPKAGAVARGTPCPNPPSPYFAAAAGPRRVAFMRTGCRYDPLPRL